MSTRLPTRIAVLAVMSTLLIAHAPTHAASVAESSVSRKVERKRKAGIELELTGIDDHGRTGMKQVLAPTLQLAIVRRLELSVRIPFARVDVDGELPAMGLSDISSTARLDLAVPSFGPVRPWATLKLQAPTGDKAAGLGGGPWMATPALGMSLTRAIGNDTTAVVQGSLSGKFIVSGQAEAKELSGRITAGLSHAPLDVGFGAEKFVPLSGGSGGLNGIIEIKYRLGPTTFALSLEPRLTGERSPEWKVKFQVGWQL